MNKSETTNSEQEAERTACEEGVFNSIRMGRFSVADLNFINALVLALWGSQPSTFLMQSYPQENKPNQSQDDQPWLS